MERARKVIGFLVLWLLAEIFWVFLLRGMTAHHPDNAAIQGLAADTIA